MCFTKVSAANMEDWTWGPEVSRRENLVLGTPGRAQRLGTHDTFSNYSPGSGQVWLDAEPRRQGSTHSLQVCVQRWNPGKGSRALG